MGCGHGRLPADWPGFGCDIRYRFTRTEVVVDRAATVLTVHCDPTDPSNASLLRESHRHWFALVTLVGLALPGYTVLVLLGAAQPPQPEPGY